MFGTVFGYIKQAYNKVCEAVATVKAAVIGTGTATLLSLTQPSESQAATVIDAATKTAITSGFTDVKDTVLDLISVLWAPLLAVLAIKMAPRLVSKFMGMMSK